MTICIGAICEDRRIGIIASDRMVTEHGLSVEFEHAEPKFEFLSNKCIALSAGEALPPTEIYREVREKIQESSFIKNIADEVSKAFIRNKSTRIENQFLRQRGLTIEEFNKKQKELLPEIVIRLDNQIASMNMNLQFLLVGVDQTGAHLFAVLDRGHRICFDRLGFHAIGSGLPHALSTFISYNYTPSFKVNKAAYVVYEAKRLAEKAPGVGKELDMVMVDEKGANIIKDADMEILRKAYEQRTAIAVEQDKKMIEILESLKLGEKKVDGS